jgi:hypothetical protein
MVQLSIMRVDADDRRYSCECGCDMHLGDRLARVYYEDY